MAAKFKVDDTFRLKKDETFTRSFPMGGYNPDGSVHAVDKAHQRAGSSAKVVQVHDTSAAGLDAYYDLVFGDLRVNLSESQLRELFDSI